MNRLIKNLGVLIFAAGLFFVLVPASAYNILNAVSNKDGLETIISKQPEKCNDVECSRICSCDFEGLGTKQSFIFYQVYTNYTLSQAVDPVDPSPPLIRLTLDVTKGGVCKIAAVGRNDYFQQNLQPIADTWVQKAACGMHNVFCCCDVEENNRSNCKRVITDEKECPNDQSKFPETSAGCESLNGPLGADKPIVKGISGKKAAESLDEAKSLNRLAAYGNPNSASVSRLIGQVIRFLVWFLGSVALIFYLYAGFNWMTASGNTEKIATAKKIYVWTTIGLAVTIGSYFIVSKLFNFIAP